MIRHLFELSFLSLFKIEEKLFSKLRFIEFNCAGRFNLSQATGPWFLNIRSSQIIFFIAQFIMFEWGLSSNRFIKSDLNIELIQNNNKLSVFNKT